MQPDMASHNCHMQIKLAQKYWFTVLVFAIVTHSHQTSLVQYTYVIICNQICCQNAQLPMTKEVISMTNSMVLVRVSLPLSAGLKILHNILHRVTWNFPIISITDSSEWEGGAFSASPTALSHRSNRYGMVHRKHDNNLFVGWFY